MKFLYILEVKLIGLKEQPHTGLKLYRHYVTIKNTASKRK
jgi:hypothetical protein